MCVPFRSNRVCSKWSSSAVRSTYNIIFMASGLWITIIENPPPTAIFNQVPSMEVVMKYGLRARPRVQRTNTNLYVCNALSLAHTRRGAAAERIMGCVSSAYGGTWASAPLAVSEFTYDLYRWCSDTRPANQWLFIFLKCPARPNHRAAVAINRHLGRNGSLPMLFSFP